MMHEIGATSPLRRLLRPGVRLVGLVLLLSCGLWLAILLHLALGGRVIVGRSARIPISGLPQDSGPVLYFYLLHDKTYHGWRRGIEWGEQPLTVVYSPWWPRIHVTSRNLGLSRPAELFHEPDFVLRLVLAGLGTLLGGLLFLTGDRIQRKVMETVRIIRAARSA